MTIISYRRLGKGQRNRPMPIPLESQGREHVDD